MKHPDKKIRQQKNKCLMDSTRNYFITPYKLIMLKKLLFMLFAAISVQGFAQKVDIDKMSIKVSTAQLPDNFIAPEMRTYFLKMEGNPDYIGDDVLNKLKLYGWNFSIEDPTLDVKVQMNDFVTGKSQLTNRKEEKKTRLAKSSPQLLITKLVLPT